METLTIKDIVYILTQICILCGFYIKLERRLTIIETVMKYDFGGRRCADTVEKTPKK